MLLTGIGAYLGYNISVKRNGPMLTSASICLSPVYAAVQAMLLIGEKLAGITAWRWPWWWRGCCW